MIFRLSQVESILVPINPSPSGRILAHCPFSRLIFLLSVLPPTAYETLPVGSKIKIQNASFCIL